ncbi:hypothetical protein [Kineococcus sp. SYSU DK001]|uniref:hypothetical protein n=1 Tax=Kineococcus sp. SYSU DK001 TaxID=3383122 RepID=UPI003D7DD45A
MPTVPHPGELVVSLVSAGFVVLLIVVLAAVLLRRRRRTHAAGPDLTTPHDGRGERVGRGR